MSHSSGNILADRRAAYAEMLTDGGDWPAAADLMRDALALAPLWPAGWFRLGEMLLQAGQAEEAGLAWQEALRRDPDDRLGARLKLELLGDRSGGQAAGFVEALFDQYAGSFESALVGKLGYRAPQQLFAAITKTVAPDFASAIDLGCGTGLMGELLRPVVRHLAGYDLSAAMLAKAKEKNIYDLLGKADIATLKTEAAADLVTAADVLNYFGGLETVFRNIRAMLHTGGIFAFTVENWRDNAGYELQDSRRYRHSEIYVRQALEDAGFGEFRCSTAELRRDRDEPVEGLIVICRAA